jgi:hypothetical protein
MKDNFFYKSLLSTLFVCLVVMTALIVFVIFTGLRGVFFIVLAIVLLLAYFYGGSRTS